MDVEFLSSVFGFLIKLQDLLLFQFSRDQFILDCPSEKLRKELEEELKMDCEEPRSHAWYHGSIPRQVTLLAHKSESQVPPFKSQVRNLLNQITYY